MQFNREYLFGSEILMEEISADMTDLLEVLDSSREEVDSLLSIVYKKT